VRATGDSAVPAMKHPSENQSQEVLAGLVERVTYHNAENGFCALRAKARGHHDVVTVVGHAATIAAGKSIAASGEWVNDRTHGQQFKARFLRTSPPTSADGIEKYLSSGMIRGIGPAYAKKLLRAFKLPRKPKKTIPSLILLLSITTSSVIFNSPSGFFVFATMRTILAILPFDGPLLERHRSFLMRMSYFISDRVRVRPTIALTPQLAQ
jgi:hypothetical protein